MSRDGVGPPVDGASVDDVPVDVHFDRLKLGSPRRDADARWARTRRSESALNAYAMSAINRVYSNDALLPTLLRGHALGIAGALPPLSRALWRHAAGI